jgi:hypothetical protein
MEPKELPTSTPPHQRPSVGRIVHYLRANGDILVREAALIVAVFNEEVVNLVAWNENGTSHTQTSVRRGGGAGNWDWPKII